jgi:hypothetical protein
MALIQSRMLCLHAINLAPNSNQRQESGLVCGGSSQLRQHRRPQATILHLLGLNHERLTYRFQGRNFRLTDVQGHVLHNVLS